MKCDNCEYLDQSGEGYDYESCGQGHWYGGPPLKEGEKDHWENCEDYEPSNREERG